MTDLSVVNDKPRPVAPGPMTFREIIALFLRTWPYIKPVRWHVVGWLSLAMGIGLVAGYITFTGVDLFNNKVLDAQFVQFV